MKLISWILVASVSSAIMAHASFGHERLDAGANWSSGTFSQAELFERNKATLQEPTSAVEAITLEGLYDFELGNNIALQKIDSGPFPTASNLLFAFDLDDPSAEYAHHVEMTAEIDLDRFDAAKMDDQRLLLAFLDENGLPIQGHYASLASVPANRESARHIAENLSKANALWLAPLRKDNFSYVFRRDKTTKQITVDEHSTASDRLGITLSTSFEDLLRSPDEYRLAVQFEGMLDGKPVVYAEFCGENRGQEIGNGLSGIGWQGYMSFTNSTVLVLFEKETWRPLIVRAGKLEIQYLDYVEVTPGVAAPLRIVAIYDKEDGMRFDFRFKVLDGKLWLFDRTHREKSATSTEDVLWSDGQAAKTTSQSTVEFVPQKELKTFDFRQIVDRRATDARESTILRGIMAQNRPWEYPGYADLMKTDIGTDKKSGATKLRMNLGPVALLKDACYFTMTWLSPQNAFAAIPGPRQMKVNAYALPPGEIAKVKLLNATSPEDLAMAAGMVSVEMKKETVGCEAKVDFLDTTEYKGLFATLSLAIAGPRGEILSAGWQNHQFANYQNAYSAEQSLHLGRPADVRPLYLVPRYHTEVYARMMGSTLGIEFQPYEPPLDWDQILSADDRRVWGFGLALLQKHANHLLSERIDRDFPDESHEQYLRDQILSPHIGAIARLLKTTKEPKYLAILAQLAGHSGDPRFHDPLSSLMEHSDKEVRESAAIQLCRCGDARGLKTVLDALQAELRGIPESKEYSPISARLADIFLALHAVDSDEVISVVGEAFTAWLKRPFGDRGFNDFERNGTQVAFILMSRVLSHSKRPQAVGYLCRALHDEKRYGIQESILVQLRSHEDNDEVRKAIIAGVEEGQENYFRVHFQRSEIRDAVAKKLLDPELAPNAFSAAVTSLIYDESPRALAALRQAYDGNLHADDPELRSAVICGLAHHGDTRHLAEAFNLLLKLIEQPLPASADKQAEYQRKSKIGRIAGGNGIAGHFPPEAVAEFLHTLDADQRPAVREATKLLLDSSEISSAYKSSLSPEAE